MPIKKTILLAGFLFLLSFLAETPVFAQNQSDSPLKYGGTYRIESFQKLEKMTLFHFFYLHPSGVFLLGAEWPKRESTLAAGKWRVSGGKLTLIGKVAVNTNKGKWKTDFNREFSITVEEKGFRLEPTPWKNRFGMLGWPNDFLFYRLEIAPNLPGITIPTKKADLLKFIQKHSK